MKSYFTLSEITSSAKGHRAREAAQKMIEAANLYEKSHEALRLRWMNILYEIGQQSSTNTIMLVPSSLPEAG